MSSRLSLPLLAALACVGCSSAARHLPPIETTDIAFRIAYTLSAANGTSSLRVVALVPHSLPDRQEVRDVRFRPKPRRVFDSRGNRYAEFVFARPRGQVRIEIEGRATLARLDLTTAREGYGPREPTDLGPWLVAEKRLEKNDPRVAATAAKLGGTDELETLRRLYDYVKGHVAYAGYDSNPQGGGAVHALTTGRGDCTEMTDLLVALCRARGLPARHILGLDVAPGAEVRPHSWTEVHTRQFGWVALDPTFDAAGSGAATFEKLQPRYLAMSPIRTDATMDGYSGFCAFRSWDGQAKILKEEYDFRPATSGLGR